MKRFRLRIAALGALMAVGLMITLPAASADVVVAPGTTSIGVNPLDAIGCTGQLGSDQVANCVAIIGTASYLQQVSGSAWTNFGSVVGHEEITGPSMPNGHINSSDQTITTTDNGPLVSWNPNRSVTPGNYCAIFWQKVSGGYSENGPACEYVS
jgi:hypothetical protein